MPSAPKSWLALSPIMFAIALLFAADPAAALTVTGGHTTQTISSTSGTVTLQPLVVKCDLSAQIDDQSELIIDLSYTKTAGGTQSPIGFDVQQASGITVANTGALVVASPPTATETRLTFNVTDTCLSQNTVTISNIKVKKRSEIPDSEGSFILAATSFVRNGSSNSTKVDTLGPTITLVEAQDQTIASEGKVTSLGFTFSENVIYNADQFSPSHWSITPIIAPGYTNIGDISISMTKSAGINQMVLGATPSNAGLRTFGLWNVAPTASNTLTDLYGNRLQSQTKIMYDIIEPVIASISPVPGSSSAQPNAPITVLFSEPMSTGTVGVQFSPPLNAQLQWSSNFETLTITPSGQSAGTTYTVTITGESLNYPQQLSENAVSPAISNSWTYQTAQAPSQPTVSSITIESGAANTPKALVSVSVIIANAHEIELATNSAMSDTSGFSGQLTQTVTLRPGLGTKTVCARAKNVFTGALSSVLCDTINVTSGGQNAPTNPLILINGGATKTTSQTVTLSLNATGALGMAIANDASMSGAQWEGINAVKQWTLTSGSGQKTVYVMFHSEQGDVSGVYNATITYEPPAPEAPPPPQNGPTGTITINNGDAHTNTIFVNVTVSSQNASQARFASNVAMSNAGPFEANVPTKAVTLAPGLGTKYVCADFRNATTGAISATACDTITLVAQGTGAPTNISISTNDGAASTSSRVVTLKPFAIGATKMAIANTADFSDAVWEDYAAVKQWTLPEGNGNKTLYIMFASASGAVSFVITDDIVLETATAPEPTTPAQASNCNKKPLPTGLFAGMLVKRADVTDTYYVGEDGCRYAFPNEKVFLSWYTKDQLKTTDKGGLVYVIAPSTLASLQLAGNVTYKPGAQLVKIQDFNNTYAVDANGSLRWVTSEAVARALYGLDWNKKVHDVNVVFWINYGFGTPIYSANDYNPNNAKATALSISKEKKLSALQ